MDRTSETGVQPQRELPVTMQVMWVRNARRITEDLGLRPRIVEERGLPRGMKRARESFRMFN